MSAFALSGRTLCHVLVLMVLSLFMTACAGVYERSNMTRLDGVLTYRQRIALPRHAQVHVKLIDKQDDEVIAQQQFETQGQQVPIDYVLQYVAADVDTAHDHVVRAAIESAQGRLLWVGSATVSRPVSPEHIRVRMQQVHVNREALTTQPWQLQRVVRTDGTIVSARDDQPSTMQLEGHGRVSGRAACNRYSGSYMIESDGHIRFSHMAATLKACMKPSIARSFQSLLGQVSTYGLAGDELRLLTGDGSYLVLTR